MNLKTTKIGLLKFILNIQKHFKDRKVNNTQNYEIYIIFKSLFKKIINYIMDKMIKY